MNSVASLAQRIARLAPIFHAHPDQISFLTSPTNYYEFLKEAIGSANHKIYMTALYLGTGELEKNLVQVLSRRLDQKGDSIKTRIHLDYFRGSRGHPSSSAGLLLPVLAKHPLSLRVSMLRYSNNGRWHSLLPSRWNEIFGLSHMKVFVFDDTVLVTGANMNTSYFTNRTDRYVCIRDHPRLAAYFMELIETLGDISFSLQDSREDTLQYAKPVVPVSKSSSHVKTFLEKHRGLRDQETGSTVIVPTLQMFPWAIDQDEKTMKELLVWADEHYPEAHAAFATGYFSPSPATREIFFNGDRNKKRYWRILISSPEANGFYGAKGLSGHIPDLYRAIELEFLKLPERTPLLLDENGDEAIYEYQREGWTYHAKGIWLESPELMVTVVGSSNFGHRSYERDLETQLTIATEDSGLGDRIKADRDSLFTHSKLVSGKDILRFEAPSGRIRGAASLFRSFL